MILLLQVVGVRAFSTNHMGSCPNKLSTCTRTTTSCTYWNPSTGSRKVKGARMTSLLRPSKDCRCCTHGQLFWKKDPMQETDKARDVVDRVDEYALLLGDLAAILIACQLQGLADVLLQPEFWNEGGFLQPILYSADTGGSFSTLSTLVQRDCITSLCWVTSALKNGGYESRRYDDLDGTAMTDLWKSTLLILVDACSIRIVGSLVSTIVSFHHHIPINQMELLREAWFTLLMIGTFRFLYQKWSKE